MSKAFTRESDDTPERPVLKRPVSSLPPGAKNYFTPDGLAALRLELDGLVKQPDSPEIRQRAFEIQEQLQTAVAGSIPPEPWDQVLFGAYVTVREHAITGEEETTYRIVGAEEVNFDKDWISWLSPLAKALMKANVGDCVKFETPGGKRVLEIVSVCY